MIEIEETLRSLWEAGRAAWPQIDLGEETFARCVRRQLDVGSELDGAALDRLRATDLYLACACAEGDPRAIRAFEEDILPAAEPALAKLALPGHVVDEVRQRLRQRLFVAENGAVPRIATYAGRGPLRGWVRVVAVRIALSLQGTDDRLDPVSQSHLEALAPVADPAAGLMRDRYRAPFESALARACAHLTSRDRTVLRLRFSDRLSIDQIGAIYGVHRATVARWIANTRERLFADTRQMLRAELGLSDAEFDGLVGLVKSQLDISISTVLASTVPD